jgi:hypothetical protein
MRASLFDEHDLVDLGFSLQIDFELYHFGERSQVGLFALNRLADCLLDRVETYACDVLVSGWLQS